MIKVTAQNSLCSATAATHDDKEGIRLKNLLKAAREKLNDEELELVIEEQNTLREKKLLLPAAVQQYSAEQLIGFGFTPGPAALLKKAFPSE